MTEDLSEELLHALLNKECKEMSRAIRKAAKAFFNKDIIRINVEEYVNRAREEKN